MTAGLRSQRGDNVLHWAVSSAAADAERLAALLDFLKDEGTLDALLDVANEARCTGYPWRRFFEKPLQY